MLDEGQLDLPKSIVDTGPPRPGSINILNVPDEMAARLGPERFWNEVNKPFLDAAIARGDDIALATRPTRNLLTNPRSGELTFFGREMKYDEISRSKGIHLRLHVWANDSLVCLRTAMIDPYAGLLHTLISPLAQLGFELEENGSHHMVFRKGDFRLEFAAERYQHPSLSSTLTHSSDDSIVVPMHIADIMSELAPDRLDRIRMKNLQTTAGLGAALRPAAYRTKYEEENRPSWAPGQT